MRHIVFGAFFKEEPRIISAACLPAIYIPIIPKTVCAATITIVTLALDTSRELAI